MRHRALGLIAAVGLVAAVGTASADRPSPAVSHSEPTGVAEPSLRLGRVDDGGVVAASESGFFAVYQLFNGPICGRFLDTEGVPLGEPFVINDESQNSAYLSVQSDGSQFVVVWLEYVEGEEQLWVQRVSSTGANVGLLERAFIGENEAVSALGIARGASGVVAISCTRREAENDCRTWLVSGEGLTHADDLTTAGPTLGLDVETSAGELLAVLTSSPGGTTLRRVQEDGTFSDGLPATIASSTSAPAVAATEDGWAILWRSGDDTRLTTLDFEGEFTTAATPLIVAHAPSSQQAYAVADGFLLASNEYVSNCGSSFCPDRRLIRRFSPAWEAIGEPIPEGERYLVDAAPSFNGFSILTLWLDETYGLSAMRHDSNDFVLANQPTPVSQVPSWQSGSRSAPGPGGWLVAWTENFEVRARLLAEDGAPKGETFTLGSARDDWSLRVREVSGHPDGWLVAWSSYDGLRITLLDPVGTNQREVSLLAGEHLQAVPASEGWTIGFNHYEPNEGMAVATRQLRLDGSVSEALIWTEFSANNVRRAFDITRSDEGYRIWWAEGGTVHARDVVAGDVDEVPLPVFEIANASWLSAAQVAESVAVAWTTDNSIELATSYSHASFPFPDHYPTELTVVGHTPLVAWTHYDVGEFYGPTELHSTGDALGDIAFDSVANTREAAFSQARGNKALLTFSRHQDYFGWSGDRVYATVVTVSEPEAGGAGPTADAGAAGATSGAAAGDTGMPGDGGAMPSDGGAGMASGGGGGASGTAPQASGGVGTAGEGAEGGESVGSMPSRTSQGCGCRVFSRSSDNDAPYVLLLLGGLALRRGQTLRRRLLRLRQAAR